MAVEKVGLSFYGYAVGSRRKNPSVPSSETVAVLHQFEPIYGYTLADVDLHPDTESGEAVGVVVSDGTLFVAFTKAPVAGSQYRQSWLAKFDAATLSPVASHEIKPFPGWSASAVALAVDDEVSPPIVYYAANAHGPDRPHHGLIFRLNPSHDGVDKIIDGLLLDTQIRDLKVQFGDVLVAGRTRRDFVAGGSTKPKVTPDWSGFLIKYEGSGIRRWWRTLDGPDDVELRLGTVGRNFYPLVTRSPPAGGNIVFIEKLIPY